MRKMKEMVTKVKVAALPVTTGLMVASMSFPALAAEANATADVTASIGIVKSVMGLFSEYPLNIFIAGGIAVLGFRIFRSGKKATN